MDNPSLRLSGVLLAVATETCDSLLIQHPIFVQQLEFVNIYPTLQENRDVTKSHGGSIIGPWPKLFQNIMRNK